MSSTISTNKRAHFDYEILDTYTAGLILLGHEVKSIKSGRVNLKGAYVVAKKTKKTLPEFYLINAHVPLYGKTSGIGEYDPYRSRKLLIKKKEINYLLGKKNEQGLTLVPIKIYTKRSLIKLEFGLGRGKKKIDKRETIKKREVDRKIRTAIKNGG